MVNVSIIVPVYNVEKYIERCAESLFAQSMDNLEYIFIDDCSPDNSIEIVKHVLERYPNRKSQVKIYRMPKNSGLPIVRRYGIENANGEYIMHCDSDDWLDLSACEELYNYCIKSELDILLYDYIRTDGVQETKNNRIAKDLSFKDKFILSIVAEQYWSLCRIITKRQLFIDNEFLYPTSNNGEDFALFLQILHYAKSYAYIAKPYYKYFYNQSSISNTVGDQSYIRRVTEHQDNIRLLELFYKKNGVLDKSKDILFYLKFYSKTLLFRQTKSNLLNDVWNGLYPEIGLMKILLNCSIKLSLKIKYILTSLRL